MELNYKLLDLMKQLNVCNDLTKDNSIKLQNKEKIQPGDVFDNVIKSLDLLDMVFKLEPDADIRFLHYDYLDCLDKEDYIGCQRIVDQLQKTIVNT